VNTVFARMNAAAGNIKPREFTSYFGHWQVMQNFLPYAHAMIVLDVSPEKAKERCDRRGRPEEIARTGGFPLDYMRALDDAYQELFAWAEKRMKVIRVGWETDHEVVHLSDVREDYPLLTRMYEFRGVNVDAWPKVLPIERARSLVQTIKHRMPEPGFWDRTASLDID
jgi:deoxyadenosine/deoxycytidine kinase